MLKRTAAFAEFPVLRTARFVLRAPVRSDAAPMFRIMRDERVTRYFGQPPMSVLDEALQRIERVRTAFREQRGVRWAIALAETDELIGSCGFWRLVPEHFRAEIGYELAPEWWGKGAMPEALEAVLTFGFTTLGLHTVEANIHPDNTGSRRVLEKLGFVQEGYFRESFFDSSTASFTDTATFGLLKADWERRTAAQP
jgi:ribosomal-protein-alanine N-acetyltransferase